MKKTKIFFLVFAIFAAYALGKQAGTGTLQTVAGARELPKPEITILPIAEEAAPVIQPVPQNLSPAPTVSAAAVLIADSQTGTVMFEKNPKQRLPIASLTKLMTALVALESGSLDDTVEISPTDLVSVPYNVAFSAGEKVLVRDLLTAMLVSSANDAALALSRYGSGSTVNFVLDMNDKADALGMTDTSFSNPVGFDNVNHYSTAEDLSKLVREFMRHPELMEIVKLKSAEIKTVSGKEKRRLYTTNQLLVSHPEVIGLKTGYTAEAKGSLIILVDNPHYYSILLGSPDREKETELLIEWVKKEFVWK